MRRREFVVLLGSTAVAWARGAQAQQSTIALVGLFVTNPLDDRTLAAIRQGLKEGGYVEGRNLAIKYRSADGRSDRLPVVAAELVADPSNVIVALQAPAALAAKSATSSIPIVFVFGADPVALGLVSSLNRPGGNVTGVTFLINALGAKRLELLRELVPSSNLIGFLVNPGNPASPSQTTDIQAAAGALGVDLLIVNASNEREIEAAFTSFVQRGAHALVAAADGFFSSRRDHLVALAARHALPVVYSLRGYADSGGLISYGASTIDAYRIAGGYAARILKGEKPADLPVQQTVKFELVVNLRTAKALGLTVPDKLLAIADDVIE
jgi:putative ABC transport system substrate-binding protein